MPDKKVATKIGNLVNQHHKLVIIQPDNPDIDSLASALALEQIFTDLGKDVELFCAIELPSYLQEVTGADRVNAELPNQYDLAIIVDTSSNSLLAKLDEQGNRSWLASRPLLILDHHPTEPSIDFANIIHNPQAAATGEVIYELAISLGWKLNDQTIKLLAMAILSDSLGLSSESTTARTVHIIGELVERGVNLAELENTRRESIRRDPTLIAYKGLLLQRVEFHYDYQIATLVIPWEEIEKYSPLYNPSMLVIDDMRLTKGTEVAICFKIYNNSKITAKIRTNHGYPIAGKLAEYFGGGGHNFASGFKITDGTSLDTLKSQTIDKALALINEIKNIK